MIKLQDKIEDNASRNYQKSYATLKSAKAQVAKAEARLDITIDALFVALPSGRITVAISSARSYHNDPLSRGIEMTQLLHGTNGWIIF